jgi:hypothetical protein
LAIKYANNEKNRTGFISSIKLQLQDFIATHSLLTEDWLNVTTEAIRTAMGMVIAKKAGDI